MTSLLSRTHCSKGHELTEANTRWRTRSSGPCKGNKFRECLVCFRARRARFVSAHREEVLRTNREYARARYYRQKASHG